MYSPIAFGKKTDPNGDYIRKWVPQLVSTLKYHLNNECDVSLQRDFPAKYIYEPWSAPSEVQRAAGCVVGRDYPVPMVDHAEASQRNKDKIADTYAAHKLHQQQNVSSSSSSSSSKGGVKAGGGSLLGKRKGK